MIEIRRPESELCILRKQVGTKATGVRLDSELPQKRAKKAKKPDSGYSIFFRTQRQLLQESGESIEQAYEREVAPLSTLSDERHRSKALVKLIAARWKRLNRMERMKYDALAEQQRIQQSKKEEQQQQEQSSSSVNALPGGTSSSSTVAANRPTFHDCSTN